MEDEEFDLWLEFEHSVEPAGTPQPYFNMVISFRDGRTYSLNVWVASAIPEILDDGRELGLSLNGGYSIGPDLIVRSHERAFLEAVVRDLVAEGELLPAWLVPPDAATPE